MNNLMGLRIIITHDNNNNNEKKTQMRAKESETCATTESHTTNADIRFTDIKYLYGYIKAKVMSK